MCSRKNFDVDCTNFKVFASAIGMSDAAGYVQFWEITTFSVLQLLVSRQTGDVKRGNSQKSLAICRMARQLFTLTYLVVDRAECEGALLNLGYNEGR
jgi:hypothetical protein